MEKIKIYGAFGKYLLERIQVSGHPFIRISFDDGTPLDLTPEEVSKLIKNLGLMIEGVVENG